MHGFELVRKLEREQNLRCLPCILSIPVQTPAPHKVPQELNALGAVGKTFALRVADQGSMSSPPPGAQPNNKLHFWIREGVVLENLKLRLW